MFFLDGTFFWMSVWETQRQTHVQDLYAFVYGVLFLNGYWLFCSDWVRMFVHHPRDPGSNLGGAIYSRPVVAIVPY